MPEIYQARRQDPMTWPMRAMNWMAQSQALDKLGARKTVERLLYRSTRTGFKTIAAGRKGFAPVLKLAKPARLKRQRPAELFDLTLTDEQEMLRDSVRRLVDEVIAPVAESADAACCASAEVLQQIHELGLNYIAAPEELGGAAESRPIVTNMIMAEELGRGDMGIALAALAPIGVLNALVEWGTAEQQATYLPLLTEEQPVAATLAVNEPHPGADPACLKTVARKVDGGYELSGEKALVPLGASAEFMLVAAQVADTDERALFIVAGSAAGLGAKADPSMGIRAAATAHLKFEATPAQRLGGEDTAFDYAEFLALSRIGWNALACGTAAAVRDYVIPYVKERTAFGEPVAYRQGVAFMIADIGIELDGMQLANWRAASLADQGKDARRAAYLAHLLASEKGMKIGTDGVQLLGGHGFVKEHPVERWYRNLRATALAGGGFIV